MRAGTVADATEAPLVERVAARLADLSPAERRVASFLAEHPEEAAFISAADVAAQLGTSDATVVRTVQSLGYSGLPELKRELVNALKSRATPALRLGRSLQQGGARAVLRTARLGAARAEAVAVTLSASRGAADMWSTITTTAVLMDALLFGIAIADRPRSLATLEALNELRAQITGQPFRGS